jgi:hypothetical protein
MSRGSGKTGLARDAAAARPSRSSARQAHHITVPSHRAFLGLQQSAGNQAASHIAATLGSGEPLKPEIRAFMEERFGADFSDVRVHSDAEATRTASQAGAAALAQGPDIVIRSGLYQPNTAVGQRLIAHELAHVVQSASGPGRGGAEAERGADRASAEAVHGAGPVTVGGR